MAIELAYALSALSFIILLGFISETLFNKTHIPDVLILFVLGILIGPVFNYIAPEYFSNIEPIFVSMALILIIFEGGLNLKISDLVKGAYKGALQAIFFYITCMCVVTFVMLFFGYPLLLALLLGTILGGTCSAITIPMVRLLKMENESSLILTLESTLTDVLCIVGTMTVIELIRLKTVIITDIIYTLLSTFLVALFLGGLAGTLWFFIKNKFHQFDRAYMTTIAAMILLYVFTESIHSNGAIAVLAFGVILGNSKKIFSFIGKEIEYRVTESEKIFYSEVTFFVKVFFFVYLGIIMNFTKPLLLVTGAVITVLIALCRPYIVRLAIKNLKEIPLNDRIIMSIMTPQGLAAAILVQIAISNPHIAAISQSGDLEVIALSVILFSIVLTSLLVFYYERKFAAQIDAKPVAHVKPKKD